MLRVEMDALFADVLMAAGFATFLSLEPSSKRACYA